MSNVEELIELIAWLDKKSKPLEGFRTTIFLGNVSREVLMFNVWVRPTLCVTVPLANYDRQGVDLDQIKKLLWERVKESEVEAAGDLQSLQNAREADATD